MVVIGEFDLSDLFGVRYVELRHPGNTSVEDFFANLDAGGNCEILELAGLDRFGFDMPSMRAREQWHDTEFTEVRQSGNMLSPLTPAHDERRVRFGDIFFFLPKGVAEGVGGPDEEDLLRLHVGVFIGRVARCPSPYGILHNPKGGPSTTWPLHFFTEQADYRLVRVKRPCIRKEGMPPLPIWIP